MDFDYVKIPRIKKRTEYYEDGANTATQLTIHKCFCKKGTIEHHKVPGFDDDWFEINCPICDEKYHSFIDVCGKEWKVYLK